MKVFALGMGNYGLPAVRLLAASDLVTEIAVAGRSVDKLEIACEQLGPKAIPVQVDATDTDALSPLLAGYDVVVEATTEGCVRTIVTAAIRSRTHYCGISDPGADESAVFAMDREAQAAGVAVFLGIGIQPGLTGLMAKLIGSRMDRVEQLQLSFPFLWRLRPEWRFLRPQQWSADPRESLEVLKEFRFAIQKNLWERFGRPDPPTDPRPVRAIRVFRDGGYVDEDPVTSGVECPTPSGTVATEFPYASLEPYPWWLPSKFGAAPPAWLKFSPLPPQLHERLRELSLRVAAGELDTESGVSGLFDTVEADPERWLAVGSDYDPPLLWVAGMGHKEGRALRIMCALSSVMWSEQNLFLTTGAPLAAAVFRALRGDATPGISAPEDAFDPEGFFDEVSPLLDPPPDGPLVGESTIWYE